MMTAETSRRLAELNGEEINRIERLIREGWGGQSIKIETGKPLRLVNAVFKWLETRGY